MMTGSGSRHDDLEARLSAALRDGLDVPVRTTVVLDGARRGAVRLRRRRRGLVAAAALAAVVAVPVGLDLADVGATRGGDDPADSLQMASPVPSGDGPTDVARFPDSPPLEPGDFSLPMDLSLDLGHYADIATVDGQSCDVESNPGRPRPTAGRLWSWDETGSERMAQATVGVNLTAWQDAGQALEDVRGDTGFCTFLDPVVSRPSPLDPAGDGTRWVGSTARDGLSYGYAAVRAGEVLVAVTVQHPRGEEAAAAEADRLASVARQRTLDALG